MMESAGIVLKTVGIVMDDPDATRHVAFLLFDGFSMLAFASALEPLRVANRLADRSLYAWRLYGATRAVAFASNGMPFAVVAVDKARPAEAAFVCAGFNPPTRPSRAVGRFLRAVDRRGGTLGGIDTGTFVLAAAGLLDGYRATAHWEALDGLRERFARVDVRADLYETDRRRLTCAGGTAALDLMLALIRMHHGRRLAAAVAEQFMHGSIRAGDLPQRPTGQPDRRDLRVRRALAILERSLAAPPSVADLAAAIGISPRQLHRLFAAAGEGSPVRALGQLRLEHARQLVQYSSTALSEIAVACGYGSYAHFSRSYHSAFGLPPSRDRRRPAWGGGPIAADA